MPSLVVEKVRGITGEDLQAVIDFCERNYHGNIELQTMLGGDLSLERDYHSALLKDALFAGEVYMIRDEKNNIIAMSVWYRPGKDLWSTPEQRALGFDALFSKLTPDVQKWWGEVMNVKFGNIKDGVFFPEEIERRWWCVSLVTDEPYRRKGYASAIINTVLLQARYSNGILGLATGQEKNVAVYKGMGFTERGKDLIPSPLGGFTVHILSKE